MIISEKIHNKARYIIENGLQGIKPYPSFDIGKIDYRIDEDTIDMRIDIIINQLFELIIKNMAPLSSSEDSYELY